MKGDIRKEYRGHWIILRKYPADWVGLPDFKVRNGGRPFWIAFTGPMDGYKPRSGMSLGRNTASALLGAQQLIDRGLTR